MAPASSAAEIHGEMLPSWSSRVTMISSPSSSSRTSDRDNANASVVILGPNTTSLVSQFKKSPIAALALSTISSVSMEVMNSPPRFALLRSR